MHTIYVTNSSTRVGNSDLETMCAAIQRQIARHVAPIWGREPVAVTFASSTPPDGEPVIDVRDDPDTPDALGWHTEDPNVKVYGYVFAAPVLDNGGDILYRALSVSSVLSHEVLETFGDVACNNWADDHNGTNYALELCDSVEGGAYQIDHAIAVSDFVTPAWFDANAAPNSRFDWMRLTTRPFEIASQGYAVIERNGQVGQMFGERFPQWRRSVKAGRGHLRGLDSPSTHR